MSDLMGITQSAMVNDVERLRSISQNLANLTTVGYKREITRVQPFADLMLRSTAIDQPLRLPGAYPTVSQVMDNGAGPLRHTGNALDLALEDNAFFVVRTNQGEAYTRQGHFRLDDQGRLVTRHGTPVLGEAGEIRLTTPQPRIDQAGRVWDGTNHVATLRLVVVTNAETLQRSGDGFYLPADNTGLEPAGNARVRQGYLESANVVPMQEMIRMIETVRHFEASQRLMRGYDSMLDRAINSLGEV